MEYGKRERKTTGTTGTFGNFQSHTQEKYNMHYRERERQRDRDRETNLIERAERVNEGSGHFMQS